MRQLWTLMLAVFLLFSVIGFYVDIMNGGDLPYAITIAFAIISGLNATLWILALSRLPMICTLALIVAQFFIGQIDRLAASAVNWLLHPADVPAQAGTRFAASAILSVVILSYSFFTRYMGISGKEAFRLKNELELAHSIQKTLVPRVNRITKCFEIYGVSEPSEKVGGDLVDVVELCGGDTVAYLADIAGHGLQAGILMGMLKTSARTALTDENGGDGGAVLSMLMQRLNVVLPQVKEAHMYATFTALRLNADGQVFYGMAASPPLLHWKARTSSMVRIEEEQFPLGLLPVADFPASGMSVEPGDIIVIATDGILEVTGAADGGQQDSSAKVEFGAHALESLVAEHAALPLPALAEALLNAAHAYGRQFDDQTLLLVRRV